MISHELFVQWAEDHFDDVKISGSEVKIPDIWWQDEIGNKDTKNHCWVNTQKGCFRAFKSNQTGSVFELVMFVEGCSWDEAKEKLGSTSLKHLENRVAEFLKKAKPNPNIIKPKNQIDLPENTYFINSLEKTNPFRIQAENYLKSRNLSSNNLMICIGGRYSNRIVIPYFSIDGDLIYFNARDISKQSKLKYLGPPKDIGVGKSDVLWMATYPPKKSILYLTEGEFDAMVLHHCGLFAGACGGKSLSDKQIEIIRDYEIIMSFDNDKAGEDSFKIASDLFKKGIKKVGLIRPPVGYKDWNELYIAVKPNIIRAYIENNTKMLDGYYHDKY